MHKKISIITINFNNLGGLKRTVESVIPQKQKEEIEWVVIDGGSKDGSVEYLKSMESHFQQLVIEKDTGIYNAMNKGLNKATGEYVWFLNSGDTLNNSDVYTHVLNVLNDAVDCVYGDTLFVDEDGKELGKISELKPQPFPKSLDFESFRFGMNICHQSFIARKSLCEPYDEKYRLAADVDWVIKILKKRPVCKVVPGIVANFEVGGSSYQHTKKAWKERFAVLSNHYGLLPNLFAHGWIVFRRIWFNLKLRVR